MAELIGAGVVLGGLGLLLLGIGLLIAAITAALDKKENND